MSEATVGAILVFGQIGFGMGLFLITPLGDMTNRRGTRAVARDSARLGAAGRVLAPNLPVLLIATILMGAATTAVQAASLAADGQRARVVSTLFDSTLVGILGARTVSGTSGGASYNHPAPQLAGVAGADPQQA